MGLLYNAADQVTTHTEHKDHYETVKLLNIM